MNMISTYVGIRDLPKWSAFLGVLSLVFWLGLFTSPRMCTTGGIDEGGGVCADAGDALLSWCLRFLGRCLAGCLRCVVGRCRMVLFR